MSDKLIVDSREVYVSLDMIFIFGYLGSGVNHLRWLVLMADCFSFANRITADDKLNFIETAVYPDSRTYKNWIKIEKRNKRLLRPNNVKFDHNVWKPEQYKKILNNKSIFLDTEPIECLRHYFMFMNNLNGIKNKDFLHSVHLNRRVITEELKNLLVLNSSFLFERQLSKNVIKGIEDFLEVSIPYLQASKVHELWYDLKTKAESEFIHDVRTIYKER